MSESLFERIDREEALRAVLDHLGARYKPHKMGWQKISCVNKDAHPNGDRNPSCSINLGIGRVKCHSCGLRGDWAGIMYEIEGMKADAVIALLELEEGGPSGTIDTGSSGGTYIF